MAGALHRVMYNAGLGRPAAQGGLLARSRKIEYFRRSLRGA